VPHDRDLLAGVARKDEDAFERLYDIFADRVFRYSLVLVRDRHLAEEVLQETMVALWQQAASFSGRSQVSTWIFGIARNQAYTLLKREEREARRSQETAVLPDPAAALDRNLDVLAAVETLPPGLREVVFLTFYEGLSYRQIAAILDIPEGTVKSRMYHAKRRLAEALI